MKILHISTYDRGGAATACIRLHKGLLRAGVQSKLLLKFRSKIDDNVYQFDSGKRTSRITSLLNKLLPRQNASHVKQLAQSDFRNTLPKGIDFFSFPETDSDITASPLYHEADLIHLHWVAGFLDYSTFFRKNTKPVVWTIHDMEPFQGGIHYQEKYFGVDDSGNPIPFTIPDAVQETINRNLKIKTDAVNGNRHLLNVVAPSRWLHHEARKSELLSKFQHTCIPYGADEQIFKPRDRNFSKELFDIPKDKVCLLFVSDHVETFRKGFIFLREAIKDLDENKYVLCAIGSVGNNSSQKNLKFIGRIEDERLMSLAYSAADAFIIPSLEDNLPNTVLESLLCGTPVIGFNTGGIPDMVESGVNGYLAEEISVDGLRNAIYQFIKERISLNPQAICERARTNYSLATQANSYIKLYDKLLINKNQ